MMTLFIVLQTDTVRQNQQMTMTIGSATVETR